MRIDFQQGIVTHPMSGSLQAFLAKTGTHVSLQAANGRTDVAFANGDQNYLLTESADVPNAWGPLAPNTDYWLYWDIDMRTAVRTFGFTTLVPIVSNNAPAHAAGQHWFNSFAKKMYVSQSGVWREVLRVFAAKVNNAVFTSLSLGIGNRPFAGTQVGLNVPNVAVGRIIVDDQGDPIRRANGKFFTTEDDFFTDGSPVNAIRLEANVVHATALVNMSRFSIVRYSEFGQLVLAEYDDAGSSAMAILLEDLTTNQVGTVCIQGVVTNPLWNWPTVGAPLWVGAGGALVSTDPHLSNPLAYPVSRVPVGRVFSPTSIFFDQGLGSKGDKGDPGDAGNIYASPVVAGVTRLSVNAVDPGLPIAVGDNDPRVANAVLRTGDTMTGFLTLNADPVSALHAATKQYVDSSTPDLSSRVAKAGDTMTGFLTLNADPTDGLHAATKQYVDSSTPDLSSRVAKAGDTMTGFLTLNADPVSALHAATKQYVDDAAANAGDVSLDAVNVFTATQLVSPVIANVSGPYAPNASLSNNFQLTLTGNLTLSPPTNLLPGMVFNIELIQDGVGQHTITLDTIYKFPSGMTPTWILTAGAKSLIAAYYDGTELICAAAGDGVSLANSGVSTIIVSEGTAARTITLADVDRYIRFTATGAKTCTFNSVNSLAVPGEYHIANRSASGNLTLIGTGITLNPPKSGTLVLEPGDTVTVKMISSVLADVFGSTTTA